MSPARTSEVLPTPGSPNRSPARNVSAVTSLRQLVALGFTTLPDISFRFAERIEPPQRRHRSRIGRDRHARTINQEVAALAPCVVYARRMGRTRVARLARARTRCIRARGRRWRDQRRTNDDHGVGYAAARN